MSARSVCKHIATNFFKGCLARSHSNRNRRKMLIIASSQEPDTRTMAMGTPRKTRRGSGQHQCMMEGCGDVLLHAPGKYTQDLFVFPLLVLADVLRSHRKILGLKFSSTRDSRPASTPSPDPAEEKENHVSSLRLFNHCSAPPRSHGNFPWVCFLVSPRKQ